MDATQWAFTRHFTVIVMKRKRGNFSLVSFEVIKTIALEFASYGVETFKFFIN